MWIFLKDVFLATDTALLDIAYFNQWSSAALPVLKMKKKCFLDNNQFCQNQCLPHFFNTIK